MKTPLYILIFYVVTVASKLSEGDDHSAALPDLALQPPRVTADLDPDTVKSARGAQGVPAIERTALGGLVCGTEPARRGEFQELCRARHEQ